MYREIVEILKCPICGNKLILDIIKIDNEEIIEGTLSCDHDHVFNIVNGVIDFGSIEQKDANSWSEYYKELNFEEVDKAIDDSKTDKQKHIEKLFIDGITDQTNKLTNGFLLDVASGRGMLLKRLVNKANKNVHIIATDLSFEVLMYDRIKYNDQGIKVSYVACDATKLPFIDNSIDMICTFAGYMNMGNIMEQGIQEASRVLKANSKLIDSVMYMDENSQGYQEVKDILIANDMPKMADNLIKDNIINMHKQYFSKVTDHISYEGIGEKVEGDLLPYAGSWYANAIITCIK